ncbi:RND transporter, partial [Burkholderia gladioli]|nr:RND transporter [Burkholderia gladioli]
MKRLTYRCQPALHAARPLAVAAALSASLALSGCSLFAPNDAAPAMPSPAHYGAAPLPESTVAAQGVAQHFAIGAQPVPDWWKQYRSDRLDALVDE